eukprot:TRINITY_DN8536_c0_g1_i1.p1 TRINITY_DN8536_c0_g1~~TRINITY_DN8536_c0_g1_i1.p1  ORF type:complete len:213 (+),score=25.08 TRINITY_DN8536_c0_g1_i1:68-706(+)
MSKKQPRDLDFRTIINDAELVLIFESFVRKMHCDENLLCWRDIEFFKNQYENLAPEEKKEAVQKMNLQVWDTYFDASAPFLVNLDCEFNSDLREQVQNSNALDLDTALRTLLNIQEEVYNLMYNDSFLKFKRSDMWEMALRRAEKKRKKRTGSSILGFFRRRLAGRGEQSPNPEKRKRRRSVDVIGSNPRRESLRTHFSDVFSVPRAKSVIL